MNPHVLELVPDDVRTFFVDVSRVVENLDEVSLPDGELLSCHMLARAISARMHNKKTSSVCLRTKTGFFGGMFTHSWLVATSTQDPFQEEWVIDPYPVGAVVGSSGGALLWARIVARSLYEPREKVTTEVLAKPNFRRHVRAASDAVSRTKKALGL
jgi:hypothetical protein